MLYIRLLHTILYIYYRYCIHIQKIRVSLHTQSAYAPVTFKINEDTKSSGAPEVVQVYSMSSSSKVTLLTMTPITMPSRVSIVWLGVSPVTIVPFRVKATLNKFPLLVNTVSQVRFIAPPTHASDGIPTNGC